MLKVSLVVWIILGTVLAGLSLLTVLMVPSLDAMKTIPYGALAGFLLAMPLSYLVARQIAGTR